MRDTVILSKRLCRHRSSKCSRRSKRRERAGGEIAGYTEMLNEARQIATKRMVDEATTLGADAIVGVRYGSSAVMQGAAEIVAYGTAVKFR